MTRCGCHAALVRQGASLRVEEVSTGLVQPGGVLVAISFAGVCGTDLQILNGTRPDTAQILGHEGTGTIAKAGTGAGLRVGERVVFNPTAQLSRDRILGHNVPGLFQRYIEVSSQAVEDGLVLSAEGPVAQLCATLVEPLGSVVYAHELISRIVPEMRTVAVFGAGPIGILATRYLSDIGIRVMLVHPRWARLNTAIRLGLVHPDSPVLLRGNLPTDILARNDGTPLDAAIICTTRSGAPQALQQALAVLKDGGCIDFVANYPENATSHEGISTDAIRSVRAANICGMPRNGLYAMATVRGHRIAFTGHRGTSRDHLSRAMQLLGSKLSPYARLITHVLSLNQAASAIESLATSHDRFLDGRDCIKAVIDMTRLA